MTEELARLDYAEIDPSGVDARVVVIHDVRTRTERELVRKHAEATYGGGVSVVGHGPWAAADFDDDVVMTPVRVIWASTTHAVRPSEVLAHLTPRRPWPVVQPVLAWRAPGATTVVEGEPARLGDLRTRFASEQREWGTLEEFIAHLGTVACDRAERRLVGDRYKVPRNIADEVSASGEFRNQIRDLASATGEPFDTVLGEAKEALTSLVATQSPAAIDAYRTVLSPMHSGAWNVHVDEDALETLRDVNKTSALIFLPAHRSYVDPLVLAEVLHTRNFPRNHVLGGNNMAIWPIGPLGKRAGVIFIKRTNANKGPYKIALREYLAHLVAKRFNLEWYIEGGRTRTGKLRPPKLGLLSYLTRAVQSGRTDDVQLVPVSILYDYAHEVDALADEQAGGTKMAEGTRWLARYIRAQNKHRGNAWVTFGTPFSLCEAMDRAGQGPSQLEKVAFQICDGINRITPISPTAMVTFALLGAENRALTLSEVRTVTEPLLDYLTARELPRVDEDLHTDGGIRTVLDQLVDVGVAAVHNEGPEPIWTIREGRHTVAAFYRNGALHHLVTRAIVELAVLHVAEGGKSADPVAAAWREARRLRDLLKFEFFFPTMREFRDQVVHELELIDVDWTVKAVDEHGAEEVLLSTVLFVAPRSLRSFFDAQLVTAQALAETVGAAVDEDAFVSRCLGLGGHMLRRGDVVRADSVSKELYTNGFALARNLRLADGDDVTELRSKRTAYLDQIRDVIARLDRLAELEQRLNPTSAPAGGSR